MLKRGGILRSIELVKSFQASVVLEQLKRPHDLVFARFLNANSVAFFSWPGLNHEECADAMLSMPAEMRTCHTVFGRANTPVHLALDVDCAVPPQLHTVDKAVAFRRDTVTRVVERLDKHIAGKGHRIQRQLVLLSPNLKKCSVHVHVALEGCIFANHHALSHYLQPLAKDLPEMDMNIFRNNGTLRCFHNRKIDGSSELVPYGEVAALNVNTAGLTARDMMQMSFIVADLDAPEVKKCEIVSAPQPVVASGYSGDADSVTCPSRARDVLDHIAPLLAGLPDSYAIEYRQWVGVGLQLKLLSRELQAAMPWNPQNIDEFLLQCWDDFSRRAPSKYRPGMCRQRWQGFRPNGPRSWRAPYRYFASRSTAHLFASPPSPGQAAVVCPSTDTSLPSQSSAATPPQSTMSTPGREPTAAYCSDVDAAPQSNGVQVYL